MLRAARRHRSGIFQKDAYEGRQMRFGVREHGMSSILNGMFAYGGIRPMGATFLNFITYAWGGVRLRYAETTPKCLCVCVCVSSAGCCNIDTCCQGAPF